MPNSCFPSIHYNKECTHFYACVMISIGVLSACFSIIFAKTDNQSLVYWAVGMIAYIVGWWSPSPKIKDVKDVLPTTAPR